MLEAAVGSRDRITFSSPSITLTEGVKIDKKGEDGL